MRLNQYIAHNTSYSRREADELIKQGKVKIDHKVATLTSRFSKENKIFVNGRQIHRKQGYSLIIYHKPKGEIVSKKDEKNRRTIYDTLTQFKNFVYVGRLDFASEGLLILSDDKNIAHLLSTSKLARIYNIKLNKPISRELIKCIELMLDKNEGLHIRNKKGAHEKNKQESMYIAPFLDFEILKDANISRVRVSINEGQNRELRRFFAQFGYEIMDLKRIGFGFCSLNALPCGKWRYFTKQEYAKLKELQRDVENPHIGSLSTHKVLMS